MRSIVSLAAAGSLLLLLTPSEAFVLGGGVGAVTSALSSSSSGTGGYLDSLSDYSAHLRTLRESGDSPPDPVAAPLPAPPLEAPLEVAEAPPLPPPSATAVGGGGAGGGFMADLGGSLTDLSGRGAVSSDAYSPPPPGNEFGLAAPAVPLVRDASETAWNSARRGIASSRRKPRPRQGGMGIGGIDPFNSRFNAGATPRPVESLMTQEPSTAAAEASWSRADGVGFEVI